MDKISFPIHLRVGKSCVLCRHEIQKEEVVALVFGGHLVLSRYRGCTPKFTMQEGDIFPQSIKVYSDNKLQKGNICFPSRSYFSHCFNCDNRLEKFTFHVDCFGMLRSATKFPFRQSDIWYASTWLRPYPNANIDFETPQFNTLNPEFLNLTFEMVDVPSIVPILRRISQLPSKIQRKIQFLSKGSPLWRYVSVLTLADTFLDLTNPNAKVKLILPQTWVRGQGFQDSLKDRSISHPMMLGLDTLGIKTCQAVDDVGQTDVDCEWYLAEEDAPMDQLKFESLCGFLRFPASSKINLWLQLVDKPIPPARGVVQYAGDISALHRIRTIDLSTISGLTFFCNNSMIYGIHAHTKDSPSALEMYYRLRGTRKTPWISIFFPLSKGEKISGIWARQHLVEFNFSLHTLVLSTTYGRGCVLSDYPRSFIPNITTPIGTEVLLYNEPYLGEPIMCFGALNSNRLQATREFIAPVFQHPNTNPPMYLSHALLEDLITVIIHQEKETGNCQGLQLVYGDGRRESLGQSCVTSDETIVVSNPISIHICRQNQGRQNCSVQIKVSSESSGNMSVDDLWETLEMKGRIIWWFNEFSTIVQFA